MHVIDSNVVSELMQNSPNLQVLTWFDRRDLKSLYLTSITEAELRAGIFLLPHGYRREALATKLQDLINRVLGNRVLHFDSRCARAYASVITDQRAQGVCSGSFDAMIAATCLVNGATLVTRNLKYFRNLGFDVVNPWETGA